MRSLLWNSYRKQTFIVLGCFFLLFFVSGSFLLFFYEQNESSAEIIAASFFAMAFLLPIMGYWGVVISVEKKFMPRFAQTHGYSYQANGSRKGFEGALFSAGYAPTIENMITGIYLDYPFRLFNYFFEERKDGGLSFSYTVLELAVDSHVPSIVLVHGRNIPVSTINPLLSQQKKLVLEGDFSTHFTLYVTPGSEIDALEIFTPDFMQDMIDRNKNFQIEFFNNHIYIYCNRIIGSEQELLSMYELGEYLIKKISMRGGHLDSSNTPMSGPS